MKIELDNRTHWRSDHLKAFIVPCLKEERPDLCKRGAPALKVKVVYTRRAGSSYSSGCVPCLRANRMTIRLSKHHPDKVDLAGVITHELAHTRGMDHPAMRNHPRYRRVGNYRKIYEWAEALPLERVEAKRKQRPTVDVKLAHAEKMLKAALTREKRAVTLRKKWMAKVKYYTKKGAEPPSDPKPPKAPILPKPKQPSLEEFAGEFGFRVEDRGMNEYEVFTKDGFHMGDGIHSRTCHGVRDVKEIVLAYRSTIEPCPADCECRE